MRDTGWRLGDDMTGKTFLLASALAALSTSIAVPAASAAPAVRAKIVDGALRVDGTPFSDEIVLRVSPTEASQLQIDLDADGVIDFTFDLASFSSIDIDAGGGNDFVQLDTTNGAFTTAKPTVVD